jgi:hypothetical protein
MENSISELFIREMNKDGTNREYIKQMRDAILELKIIQK